MAPSFVSDLLERKQALRREMSDRRAALPDDVRRACAAEASARLSALPEMASGGTRSGPRTVAGYVAVRGEIDPAAALGTVVERGGAVALPRVSREPPALRFHRVVPGATLARGRFDLYEPDPTAEEIGLEALDVMIVPGLAFDAAGRRLGFGGGYYDRVLGGANVGAPPAMEGPAIRRPVLIGFAYDFQIVERCPAGVGDVPVDLVVTDARVLRRPAGEIA